MKPLVKTLCSVLLMSCFGFAGSHAGWIENGLPLTRQWSAAGRGVIASDGSSGAIIAFQVCHDGVGHIIAQHVNSLGAVLWGEEGIEVCTATGDQGYPMIISDGAGGAIVTWHDERSGNAHIYAQRVNTSGAVQWATNGVAICTATEDQGVPQITSDGAGGAIVTWMDYRSGSNWDIYAQSVNASGAVQWTANGVALCTATGDKYAPQITSDGTGGAIVTWHDNRGGNWDIYAQRVNTSGAVQWATDGLGLCTATEDQGVPQITSDGAGGAIVTWHDHRSGDWDIYAQRVNVSGAVQWAPDGVALCTATGPQHSPMIASDGAGGVIVTWQDYRSGSYLDIYAQSVNASGAVRWATDGLGLCTATGNQEYPQIISDGAGGAIVTWMDYRSGNDDIYAQSVNASGSVQWTTDGVAFCTATGNQEYPQITSDGVGGAIVTWQDSRGIHAQRVSASGTVQWTTDGIALCTATGPQQDATVTSDGAGGAIVTWLEGGWGDRDVHAQRLNASGSVQWTTDGVALCTATGAQYPQITSDGAGGAIVTWMDYRSGNWDIYVQRVNVSGAVQWTVNGVALCTATGDQWNPTITSDGAGGAIVTWHDYRRGSYSDIYAQRVNASGAVQWTTDGVALCTATWAEHPQITSDGVGGAIVTWQDSRGNWDIYAQRVNAPGAVQWTTDGVALCTATGAQYPQIISDGAGGAIVTWWDNRSGNDDIYAQGVNASGAVQWMAGGVALCTATGDQWNPTIIADGAGGAIVTWFDYRSGNWDIYAQRVNASGIFQWTTDGVTLCTATGPQQDPRITSDGAGGAIVTWYDLRSGNWDIYAQRVNAPGAVQWTTDGVALCTATGNQIHPAIISDGAGGAIIAWEDERCGVLIYAQRVRAAGEIVSTLLQDYAAAAAARGIRINWNLSEIDGGARFSILRASAPDWRFVELESVAIDKNGLSFTCTDESCLPGSMYKYRVECEAEGMGRRVLFETDAITMPALPVTLYQNHPNPFNPQTVIRFYLPEPQEIFLDVYNVAGERVARPAEGKREKGYHEVTWDGRNSSGMVCSSGVYFSRLKAGKSTISRKMVIMR